MKKHYLSVSRNESGMAIKEEHGYWHYRIMPEILADEVRGKKSTYGIRVTGAGYDEIIHDISTDRERVELMVDMLNNHQLSPVHLQEVLEEMLER